MEIMLFKQRESFEINYFGLLDVDEEFAIFF